MFVYTKRNRNGVGETTFMQNFTFIEKENRLSRIKDKLLINLLFKIATNILLVSLFNKFVII